MLLLGFFGVFFCLFFFLFFVFFFCLFVFFVVVLFVFVFFLCVFFVCFFVFLGVGGGGVAGLLLFCLFRYQCFNN